MITLLILAIGYGLSWAISVGVMYLITLCFSIEFNLLVATGIWLVGVFLKSIFGKG